MRWVVVAHCDDEMIFAGGAILSHREEPWTVVIASQSQDPVRPAESLGCRDALRALGLDIDYRFLWHADEQFHCTGGIDPPTLSRQLSELGVRAGERVYTHGAPGEYGHNGHKAVHRSVVEVLAAGAAISVFSGPGEVVERISDRGVLADKARLFNAAYPSQKGVWRSLGPTMVEVMREERHLALSPLNGDMGEAPDPPRRAAAATLSGAGAGALGLAVGAELARLPSNLQDALVIGLDDALRRDEVRARVSGRIDLVGPFQAGPPAGDDHGDGQVPAGDFTIWDPGDRAYDLILCVGLLQRIKDFEAIFRLGRRVLRPNGQLILTHEPLIEGHADYGRSYFAAETAHYRRPAQAVIDLSRRNGLKLRLLKDLVVGRRQGEPVIYQLARLERR